MLSSITVFLIVFLSGQSSWFMNNVQVSHDKLMYYEVHDDPHHHSVHYIQGSRRRFTSTRQQIIWSSILGHAGCAVFVAFTSRKIHQVTYFLSFHPKVTLNRTYPQSIAIHSSRRPVINSSTIFTTEHYLRISGNPWLDRLFSNSVLVSKSVQRSFIIQGLW